MIIQSQHTIVIFLSLVLVLLAGCSQQQVASGSLDNLLVKETGTGPGKKDVEIIKINNCDGKAPATQVAERGQSVQLGGGASVGASGGVVQAAVMGNYSTGAHTTKSLQLTAPPGTHMEYNLEWTMEERNGMVTKEGVAADPALYRHFRPVDVRIATQKDLGCPGLPAAKSQDAPSFPSGSNSSAPTNSTATPSAVPVSPSATTQPIDSRAQATSTPVVQPRPTLALKNGEVLVEVKAGSGWQNTQIMVANGDMVSIRYLSGSWTTSRKSQEYTDAAGDNDSRGTAFGSKHFGSLVARIDTRMIAVGNGLDFEAEGRGPIWLRMDDPDVSDNDGSIVVGIVVSKPR